MRERESVCVCNIRDVCVSVYVCNIRDVCVSVYVYVQCVSVCVLPEYVNNELP